MTERDLITGRKSESWRVRIVLDGFPKTVEAVRKLKNQETGRVFDDFFRSPRFQDLIDNFHQKTSDGTFLSSADLQSEYGGFIFEQFGYRFLWYRLKELSRIVDGGLGDVVVSPELTFELLKAARPDLPTGKSYFGLSESFQGHGHQSPDGLVLRVDDSQVTIVAACEYTSEVRKRSRSNRNKREQVDYFRSGRFLRDYFGSGDQLARVADRFCEDDPTFPRTWVVDRQNFTLIYIKPRPSNKHRHDYLLSEGIVVVNVPLAGQGFRNVVGALLTDLQARST